MLLLLKEYNRELESFTVSARISAGDGSVSTPNRQTLRRGKAHQVRNPPQPRPRPSRLEQACTQGQATEITGTNSGPGVKVHEE